MAAGKLREADLSQYRTDYAYADMVSNQLLMAMQVSTCIERTVGPQQALPCPGCKISAHSLTRYSLRS